MVDCHSNSYDCDGIGVGTTIGGFACALQRNPLLANDLAVSSTTHTFIALAAANGIVGLSGALFAQRSYSVDINMGVGVTIIGLAGMILGLALARQGAP